MKLTSALLVGVAALAMLPLAEAPGQAAANQPASRFVAPERDLILTRTLVRELSDGKQIVVTRRFRIQFIPNADGYRIEGTQIGVEVDTPPNLSGLAELERKRIETGVFPLQVNRVGILIDPQGRPVEPPFDTEMHTRASALLNKDVANPEERAANGQTIARLSRKGANTPWPADLFSAAPGERRLEREVTLSDGRQGKVEVVLRVEGTLACGLPQSFERLVVTYLPGSRMVSREIYMLSET